MDKRVSDEIVAEGIEGGGYPQSPEWGLKYALDLRDARAAIARLEAQLAEQVEGQNAMVQIAMGEIAKFQKQLAAAEAKIERVNVCLEELEKPSSFHKKHIAVSMIRIALADTEAHNGE